MTRRKSDARRMPYNTPEMPMYISSVPIAEAMDVPIESSVSYDDAVRDGAYLVPTKITVEAINSFEEAFRPLSKEEEESIKDHFSGDESNILVEHTASSIFIRRNIFNCLKPRKWLQSEVINLYITLLKEREIREPKKHLKCHFFNTFFFPKLVKSGTEYDYEAVRKWTLKRTLGYHLRDCNKIFVPISMDFHWSLVVINVKEQTFQYLDSFKGNHSCSYMDVVARYFVDEVQSKNSVHIDLRDWRQEFVQTVPVQSNVYDCGMFMIKYIDFYSRGMELCFSQEDMSYFRLRTAKEILQLKAE